MYQTNLNRVSAGKRTGAVTTRPEVGGEKPSVAAIRAVSDNVKRKQMLSELKKDNYEDYLLYQEGNLKLTEKHARDLEARLSKLKNIEDATEQIGFDCYKTLCNLRDDIIAATPEDMQDDGDYLLERILEVTDKYPRVVRQAGFGYESEVEWGSGTSDTKDPMVFHHFN